MIDFNEYKREQQKAEAALDAERAAEKAYEQELRDKPISETTSEELAYLGALNSSFHGTHIDKANLERYNEICGLAVEFLEQSEFAEHIKTREPSATERHGYIYVDTSKYMDIHPKEHPIFMKMLTLCDDFGISDFGGHLRLTFTVRDVFKE